MHPIFEIDDFVTEVKKRVKETLFCWSKNT